MTAGVAATRDRHDGRGRPAGPATAFTPSLRDAPAPSGRRRATARASGRLRRAILIGAAAATIGVVWYSWFRAQDMGEVHLSLESLGISSDKITMAHPRMTGTAPRRQAL